MNNEGYVLSVIVLFCFFVLVVLFAEFMEDKRQEKEEFLRAYKCD